jgi:hypothetical protein
MCQSCGPGQQINVNAAYTIDVNGTVESSNAACAACPRSTIGVRNYMFGGNTRSGWSRWPSLVDSKEAMRMGWKLTEPGIARAANRESDTVQGIYPLTFQVR